MAVAPSCTHAAHLSSVRDVAKTRWPRAAASCMAVTPMPLVPPCTSRVSAAPRGPLPSMPRSNTALQTVKKVSGRHAAVIMSSPLGIGRHCPIGTATYSAYPPPATRAHTPSPTERPNWLSSCETSPSEMTPATSKPGMSVIPGGGGYFPSRCSTSGRLIPEAATRTSTSPSLHTGIGRLVIVRTSGPPGWEISTARMDAICRQLHGKLNHFL
jgi:hypothetical protein